MKTITFKASGQLSLWEELLTYFGETDIERNHYQFPGELGFGTVSFNEVAHDIKHFEFRLKLKEDLSIRFETSDSSQNYEILVFFHGSPKALALDYPEYSDTVRRIIRKEGKAARMFLNLVSDSHRIPGFTFKANEVCKVNFLFLNRQWLDSVLPENLLSEKDSVLLTESKSPFVMSENKRVDFNELFVLLKRFHETKSTERLVALGQLYQMLGDYFALVKLLSRSSGRHWDEMNEADLKKIHELESYLKSLENKSLPSLITLSKSVGMSKTKMCLLFKKVYGEGISNYHNKIKISKAKELLAGSSDSISQIGEMLAIGNSSYFTRWFKNYTGLSPSTFRERVLKRN
jgi:AraC-like DNA-binding protein